MLYIVYHRADLDGKSGGAALHYYFSNIEPTPHMLIPLDYHDDKGNFLFRVKDGDTVFVADFSFDREIMEDLNNRTRLVWFDHHKSAIESMSDMQIAGVRRMDMSGSGIVYTHFLRPALIQRGVPNIEVIDAVIAFISDQDNWNKANYTDKTWREFPQALNRYFQSVDCSVKSDIWKALFSGKITKSMMYKSIEDGRIILRWQKNSNKGMAANCAFTMNFQGLRAICMNGGKGSDTFASVFKPGIHDIMLSFSLDKTKVWKVSLYSPDGGVDVSSIAKMFGGGGHAGAAGFSCKSLDWSGEDLIVEQ